MPNLSPAGPLALALDGMVNLIANVPFFQTWTNTANATDALNYVFVSDIGSPISAIEIAANTATVLTREVHGFVSGQSISIEGASVGAQGDLQIAGIKTVVSVPTPTSFTFAETADDDSVSNFADAMAVPARPFAAVMTESKSLDTEQIGTGGVSNMSGSIDMLIEADVSSDYVNDSLNALTEARNACGQLIAGISSLADENYLTVSRVELAQDPMFISRPEQSDSTKRFERWTALIRVTWGLS